MPKINRTTVLETLKSLPEQKGNSGDVLRKLFKTNYTGGLGNTAQRSALKVLRELEQEGLLFSEKTSDKGYVFTLPQKMPDVEVKPTEKTETAPAPELKVIEVDPAPEPEPEISEPVAPSVDEATTIDTADAPIEEFSKKEIFTAAASIAGQILRCDHKAEATWAADKSLSIARHIARRIEKESQ